MFSRGKATHGCFVLMDEGNIARAADTSYKYKMGVLVTLYVDDAIEEALARIEKAGGKTHV